MFTNEPYTDEPYTNEPYTDSPFQIGEDIFEFTNDAVWSSIPHIQVNGTPEILWTWSDGTTDDKAIPDAVTCVGTHTLKVTPWDAVTDINFSEKHLINKFNSMPWPGIEQLRCFTNIFDPFVKIFEWPEIFNLYMHYARFGGEVVIYPWPKAFNIYFHSNNFNSMSGSFQTQIKMIQCLFQGNAITSHVQIDKMLSDFVVNAGDANRTNTCNVNFSGGTMSGPTSAGTVNQNILINTYSWTVTLNAEV